MKKLALVLATTLVSTPAMAGPYVNVESNANYTGSDFTSRATDLHVGYENSIGDLAYYIQGGKTINAVDGVDSESNFSGKLGGNIHLGGLKAAVTADKGVAIPRILLLHPAVGCER